MRCGFQRQDQPFQEPSGPPCTHSSSGCGPSPSGSTSQDRSGAAVGGGGGDLGQRARPARARWAGPAAPTGCWSASRARRAAPVRVRRRRRRAGRRRARRPATPAGRCSARGRRSARTTSPLATSTRKTGRAARLVGDDVAAPCRPATTPRLVRPAVPAGGDLARPRRRRAARRRRAMSTGSSGVLRLSRRKATVRPSGLIAGAPHSPVGSSTRVRRSPGRGVDGDQRRAAGAVRRRRPTRW